MLIQMLKKSSTKLFITLCITFSILPFLNYRVLRMAGDEKVYISQAIEMTRNHTWFIQTLAGEPNYFKGPLHYILVQLGLHVFGNQIIAGVWMNLFLSILIGLLCYSFAKKRWSENKSTLYGIASALNVGVISHCFVSQMEVEVTALYTLALSALAFSLEEENKNSHKINDLIFWLSAGICGWVKSPVHSVFIASGGLLWWTLTGQIFKKLSSKWFWISGITGAIVGLIGFLPAFIQDKENFISIYLLREQFEKANNNRAWHYVLTPLIHFSLPFTTFLITGLFNLLKNRNNIDQTYAKLGILFSLPTLIFWSFWTYKGQNYNLPLLPSLLLFIFGLNDFQMPKIGFKLMGTISTIATLAFAFLIYHFYPLPNWWSPIWLVTTFLSLIIFNFSFLFSENTKIQCIGVVAFFIAFSTIITPLGERELIELKNHSQKNQTTVYHYNNLDPSIWNEWGLMQLALGKPIYGIHKEADLKNSLKPGHTIIVQNEADLSMVLKSTDLKPEVFTWKRWLTKGKTNTGVSKWKIAWEKRTLSELEREFFLVTF